MLAPGVQSTVTWANCQKFVQKFLWSSANYSAPKNTDCWATPGSEEYAEDPCCNVKCVSTHRHTHPSCTHTARRLLWEDCCNPRYAPPITWTPNDTLISDECGDSECAYNVRHNCRHYLNTPVQLASALSTYQSTQYQCRKEGIDAAMTVYDPFSNGLNVRGLGPCASAVAGNNDTEFLEVRPMIAIAISLSPSALILTLIRHTRRSSIPSGARQTVQCCIHVNALMSYRFNRWMA